MSPPGVLGSNPVQKFSWTEKSLPPQVATAIFCRRIEPSRLSTLFVLFPRDETSTVLLLERIDSWAVSMINVPQIVLGSVV
jgi:hypothetical protein